MRAKIVPAVLLLALAVGCQNEAEPSSPGASDKPSGEPVTATNQERETPSEPKAEGDKPSLTSQDNPSRLYQLRDLAKATIKVNGQAVPVWLMNDPGKRQEGMMFLVEKDVKPNEGMLFVFPDEQAADRGFWMRNTHLPLDIVYISKAGKVVSVAAGKPFDETNLPAKAPFQYVLEMRSGGAAQLKIKVGTPVEIPSSARQTVD